MLPINLSLENRVTEIWGAVGKSNGSRHSIREALKKIMGCDLR